jgi:hypothetical protein
MVKDFPLILRYQLDHGHVPDSVYEELGYPIDTDMDGNEVRRDATISQENHQRSKCLSHSYQRQLRENRLIEIQAEATRKVAKEANALVRLLDTNTAAEAKMIAGTGKNRNEIGELDKEHFKRPTGPELKAFVHARMYNTYKLPPGAPKWPKNKGSLNDIDSTPLVACFIQQAWDVRSEIVKLKIPSKEDTLTPTPGAAATSTNPPLAENPAIVAIMRVVRSESQSEFGKASDVLQSDGFIGSINKCFNSTGNFSIAT